MKKECYRWKGPEKGNYSGQTAAWGLKNVDRWIAELKPEVALIMFGTNDIRRGTHRGAREEPPRADPEVPGQRRRRDPQHDPADAWYSTKRYSKRSSSNARWPPT